MSLTDQIIESGPYRDGAIPPEIAHLSDADDLNALCDQLIELRQLRAAAETRERYDVWDGNRPNNHLNDLPIWLTCSRCGWSNGPGPDRPTGLADLVRRADAHTQECP